MADPRPLSAIFMAGRPGEWPPDLEETLMQLAASAQATWPGLSVPLDYFVQYLAQRVEGPLASVRAADLYLACGCVRGDTRAIALFDARYIGDIDPALSRLNLRPGQSDEVKQVLREQLLVARGGPPKIAEYTGRGDLRSWVRVSAVRAALKLGRKGKRELLSEDNAMLEARSTEHDPELQHIKAVYRSAFKTAFTQALDSLSDRDKTLLKQNVVDGLSIDEIGALYRVHRATAARWVVKVKDTLLTRTRQLFMQQVQVDKSECESIMRLVESQLDLSLRRRLG
jgi:RNA polymerase sigma-70 factor, ECF subfamily